MRRRHFLAGVAGAALARPAIAAGTSVLTFVPQAELATVDPIFSTAGPVQVFSLMVFDTLYGWDTSYRPQPQMLEGHRIEADGRQWQLTLREGLRFHDNTPVLARDVAASLRRWGKRDPFGQTLLAATDEISAVSDRVVQVRLKKPFPLLPNALAKLGGNTAVIMPERLALTPADVQMTEVVGSGPFRYVANERVPGALTVFEKFSGYVPRPDGTPSLLAGPKIAYVDRVEWHTIPDASTSAAALVAGEVDWWDQAAPDLLPLLRRSPDIVVDVLDSAGFVGVIRPNHTQPPFDNPAVRRAVMGAINQAEFMTVVVGNEAALWSEGVGFFLPEGPMASDAGMDVLTGPRDLDGVRRALHAAGYRGERLVFLGASDFPSINAMGQVAGDMFRKIGMNLDYQTADWGTVTQRRNSRAPLDQGGWSAYAGYTYGISTVNPAANIFLRENGPAALGGWPDGKRLEALRLAWFDAPDLAAQQAICRDIQLHAFEDVPYYPIGRFRQPTAYRRSLSGLLKGYTLFYNVRKG